MQTETYKGLANAFEAVGMLDRLPEFLGTSDEIGRLAIAHTVSSRIAERLGMDGYCTAMQNLRKLADDFRAYQ